MTKVSRNKFETLFRTTLISIQSFECNISLRNEEKKDETPTNSACFLESSAKRNPAARPTPEDPAHESRVRLARAFVLQATFHMRKKNPTREWGASWLWRTGKKKNMFSKAKRRCVRVKKNERNSRSGRSRPARKDDNGMAFSLSLSYVYIEERREEGMGIDAPCLHPSLAPGLDAHARTNSLRMHYHPKV